MTTLQEIKAMLERAYNSSAFDERELDKLLAFTRAALPVIEAAIEQDAAYSDMYQSACTRTDIAIQTFTESYPDATA